MIQGLIARDTSLIKLGLPVPTGTPSERVRPSLREWGRWHDAGAAAAAGGGGLVVDDDDTADEFAHEDE
eukprot:6186378-Pleurochrysis_carterae.AAC.1